MNEWLPEWVMSHPAAWGTLAGVVVLGLGLLLFESALVGLAGAVPFGIGNWLVWREGGPGPRWRARLLERDAQRRSHP